MARPGRREFLRRAAAAGTTAAVAVPALARAALGQGGEIAPAAPAVAAGASPPAFALDEATIAGLQEAMCAGRVTARELAELYLARIESVDRGAAGLGSVIEANPDALGIASALDEERRGKGPRGPMHGIPYLLKDNTDTADGLRTSAGSLALAEHTARAGAPPG